MRGTGVWLARARGCRTRLAIPCVCVAALSLSCADPSPSATADLLLSNANVIDVESGTVIPGQDVAIVGSTITRIRPHGSAEVNAGVVLDLSGRYLMPGLWDMHAHIRTYDPEEVLPLFVLYGITGIRDLGLTSFRAIQEAQSAIASRSAIGPRIVSSGFIIEGPEPRFSTSVSVAGLDEAAAKFDSVAAAGVEIIKVFQNLPGPVFEAVVARALDRGLLTAGHTPSDWTQQQAAISGLRSIEHFYGLENSLSYAGNALDSDELDRLAGVLIERGTFETPTLINSPLLTDRFLRGHPDLALVPTYHLSWWERLTAAPVSPEALRARQQQVDFARAATGELARRGVKFLAGTDTPNPYMPAGLSLHKELELFVEAGLTPAAALRTATTHAAEYFNRRAQLGSVAAGYLADLVVLDANPLEDIRNTQSTWAVIADGRLFSNLDLAAIRNAQMRRMSDVRTTDLDQRAYMEVRRGGVDRARSLFPTPLRDSAVMARPEHLVRLSRVLARAGEVDESRKAVEWNLELFPNDAASRALLDSLAAVTAVQRR